MSVFLCALKQYYAPKYWATWLGLLVLRLVAFLPLPAIIFLGFRLGDVLYGLAKARRRIACINIGFFRPEWNADERAQLVKKSFQHMGAGVLEFAVAWWHKESKLKQRIHLHNIEHLHEAQKDGSGVILLSPHMSALEMGAHLVAITQPMAAIYKPARNRLFNHFMTGYREQRATVLENKQLRQFIAELKQGNLVWFAPDQDFGDQDIVFADFLGKTASTLTVTARLAKKTKAKVVPYFPVRRADHKGYDLFFFPELKDFPTGDDQVDGERINQALGDMINQAPEQYMWLHKRFKTRPEGEAKVY